MSTLNKILLFIAFVPVLISIGTLIFVIKAVAGMNKEDRAEKREK